VNSAKLECTGFNEVRAHFNWFKHKRDLHNHELALFAGRLVFHVPDQNFKLSFGEARLDLSRFDAAPLIAFIAPKETNYENETDGRIPR
jgi:hypothetical protein